MENIKRGLGNKNSMNCPDSINIHGQSFDVNSQNGYGFMCDTQNHKLLYTPKGCDHQKYFLMYTKHFFPNLSGKECLMKAKEVSDTFDLQGRIWIGVDEYDGVLSTWNKKIDKKVFLAICQKFNLDPKKTLYVFKNDSLTINLIDLFNKLSSDEWKKQKTARDLRDELNAQYNKEHGFSCDAERHFKERMDEKSEKINLNERYIGNLYHFTDLYSAYDIIKDNQINKGYYPDDIIDSRVTNFASPEEGVCLTRQKNFNSFECNICVRFALDGEKMGASLRNSKMYPLSYQGDGKNNEAEERLYNVPITPLDKYCNGIQILVNDLNKDASDRYNFLTFLSYNEKIIDEIKENLNIDLNYTLPTEEIIAKVNQYIIDKIKSNDVFGNIVNVKYKHQPTILENAEQELIAYHGSGADFDRFDHSFMGTGEGAQAFGWGTYVTTDRGTAKCYAKVASDGGNGTTYLCNGKKIDKEVFIPLQVAVNKLQTTDPLKIANELQSLIAQNQRILNIKMGKLSPLDQDKLEQRIQNNQKALEYVNNNGNTPIENVKSVKSGQIIYEVDIPDDNGENYIPWENTPKNIITNILTNLTYLQVPNTTTQNFDFWFEEIYEFNTKQNQVVSPKQLSMDLSKLGYVGIKVPTGYLSGGNGKGFNYVIFQEDDIEIIEKYDLLESKDNESLVDKDEYMIGSEGTVGDRNMNYSHVITEGYQGETMTVFHGSSRDFNQFSISDKELKLGNVFGKGIYTTTNINNAKSYVSDDNLNACDGYVYELAIPIDNGKNYLDNSKMIPKMVLFKLLTRFSKYAFKKGVFKILWKEFFDISEIRFQQFMNAICYAFNQNSQIISHVLREMGYYGVKVPQANRIWYIVFYPEDVKIVKKHIVKYNNTTFKRDLFMTENAETEMQAFHGSGAQFKQFDSKFNGSGEGSACFGPGHYFTSSKRIGKDYANEHGTSKRKAQKLIFKDADGDFYYQGHNIYRELNHIINIEKYDAENDHFLWKNIPLFLLECETPNELIKKVYPILIKMVKSKDDYEEFEEWYQTKLKNALMFLKDNIHQSNRSLYQVDIPESDKYADWASNVPFEMIKTCSKLIEVSENERAINKWFDFLEDCMILTKSGMKLKDFDFETLYYKLNNLDYDATFGDNVFKVLLKRFGYVGVKYPSGQNFRTSSTKEGDMNFTVFDDNNVKITNRWDY